MGEKPYITCRELTEFLHLYLDGELAPGEAHEFERHLAVCPTCVKYLATYEKTIAFGKAACADPDAREEVPEELVRLIISRVRPHPIPE
ncbi:MAG TPA: zf-HC2 domain-containing protein [Thermoanaerobaculia bacterium]|nr:zf-HC2 domain-containing protein [Thermoanaerobaculia bacterium]